MVFDCSSITVACWGPNITSPLTKCLERSIEQLYKAEYRKFRGRHRNKINIEVDKLMEKAKPLQLGGYLTTSLHLSKLSIVSNGFYK